MHVCAHMCARVCVYACVWVRAHMPVLQGEAGIHSCECPQMAESEEKKKYSQDGASLLHSRGSKDIDRGVCLLLMFPPLTTPVSEACCSVSYAVFTRIDFLPVPKEEVSLGAEGEKEIIVLTPGVSTGAERVDMCVCLALWGTRKM